MYSNIDAERSKIKKKPQMKDYKFLHDYLRDLRFFKDQKLKRNKSKGSIKPEYKPPLRKARSMIMRDQRVGYGLQKYKDPDYNTETLDQDVVRVGGKVYRTTTVKRVERNRVTSDNKLPLVDKDSRQRINGGCLSFGRLILRLETFANFGRRAEKGQVASHSEDHGFVHQRRQDRKGKGEGRVLERGRQTQAFELRHFQ